MVFLNASNISPALWGNGGRKTYKNQATSPYEGFNFLSRCSPMGAPRGFVLTQPRPCSVRQTLSLANKALPYSLERASWEKRNEVSIAAEANKGLKSTTQ